MVRVALRCGMAGGVAGQGRARLVHQEEDRCREGAGRGSFTGEGREGADDGEVAKRWTWTWTWT